MDMRTPKTLNFPVGGAGSLLPVHRNAISCLHPAIYLRLIVRYSRILTEDHRAAYACLAMNRSVAPFSRSLQSSTDYGALNSAPLESLLSVVSF